MKKNFQIALVATGLVSATVLSSNDVKANTSKELENNIIAPVGGGCVGSGDCGTTRAGVRLEGKWREW